MTSAHRRTLVALVLALLAALVGPAAASAAETEAAFPNRVATFNVCNPCDQLEKPQAIAAEVAKYKPQVIAFQEICVSQTNRVREILEEAYGLKYYVQHGSVLRNWWRCGGSPWRPGAYGNAILSAAPMSDPVVERYNAGGSEARGYVAVTTTVNGELVRVFATHLAQAGQAAVRARQVAYLASRASQWEPSIVLGDFNATPNASELGPMWASFRDADPNCAPPANSSCQVTHPGSGKKFDYIWLNRHTYPTLPGVGSHDNYSDHNLIHADLS